LPRARLRDPLGGVDNEDLSPLWRAFAEKYALRFGPSTTLRWSGGALLDAGITGEIEGVEVGIETFPRPLDPFGYDVRFRGQAAEPAGCQATIREASTLTAGLARLLRTKLCTGDDDVDRRFLVTARPRDVAGVLFDDLTVAALRQVPSSMKCTFEYARGRARLEWRFAEGDGELDAAARLVVATCRRRANLYR
jgi:hypothetical protein